ncbi:minor capsid protein [Salinicola salarius]|uniref:phage head morphogenesis protein n=1 Tax=Salinicola salarius TaxID=430457 RepID=UPI0023E3A515|nr:phage minor head protein [Salinicola salarius]MDF3917508.1 minor capsid protein [Salinicola salarius]
MTRQPTLPRNSASPTQTTRQRQRAFKQIRTALAGIERGVVERFEQIGYRVTSGNADGDSNQTYEYLLDQFVLDDMNSYIAELINELVMRAINGEPIVVGQAELAYQQSTAASVASMAAQTEAFRRTVEQTLLSAPYRTRIALVRARVFEEMQGFTDQTRTDLARTLADGMARGKSPGNIARMIRDRIGVAQSRAERIARTEINTAHRRAIWDEDKQTNEEGIRTRLLWVSALSATTRPTHASRHGRIYTRQEVAEFYARDGNAINCKCTQVSILVDENGKPLSGALPGKLQLQGQKFFKAAA